MKHACQLKLAFCIVATATIITGCEPRGFEQSRQYFRERGFNIISKEYSESGWDQKYLLERNDSLFVSPISSEWQKQVPVRFIGKNIK